MRSQMLWQEVEHSMNGDDVQDVDKQLPRLALDEWTARWEGQGSWDVRPTRQSGASAAALNRY